MIAESLFDERSEVGGHHSSTFFCFVILFFLMWEKNVVFNSVKGFGVKGFLFFKVGALRFVFFLGQGW